ncbi:cation transporter [Actinoplanes sp. NPDC023801]|uniref:cation transporter n=1 Tax=Actinoplanes sp. NPDC023801 TaxID=3154595 RepID=UPI0033E1B69C
MSAPSWSRAPPIWPSRWRNSSPVCSPGRPRGSGEAAHSLADTVTEVFLYVALRRGTRPADEQHPFGYGKESWVRAFIEAAGDEAERRLRATFPGIRYVLLDPTRGRGSPSG